MAFDACDTVHMNNVSRRRNPLIAELLRRSRMVEAWGRSLRLILTGEPTVKFIEIAQLFIAAFNRPTYSETEKAVDATSRSKKPEKITIDQRTPWMK